MNRRSMRLALLLASLLATFAAHPALAGAMRLDAWRGHLSFGFSKVFSDSLAPGGSFGVGGGVDYPLGANLRVGPSVGYHLLGSNTIESGSLSATIDYSLLEGALLFSWLPSAGPVARVSAGPAIGGARAELSTAGGGLAFSKYARNEVKGGFAIEATALPRHLTVVAPGVDLGLRWFPVSGRAWTLLTARATVHF